MLDGYLSVLHFLSKHLGLDLLPRLLYSQIVFDNCILALHTPTKHPVPVILINYGVYISLFLISFFNSLSLLRIVIVRPLILARFFWLLSLLKVLLLLARLSSLWVLMRIQSKSNATLLVNKFSLLLFQLVQLRLEFTYFSLRFALRLYFLYFSLQPLRLLSVVQNMSAVIKSLDHAA